MGIFSSGAEESRKVRELLAYQNSINQQKLKDAGAFAEEQITPWMIDPSVMQELQGAVTGGPMNYQDSPIFQRYMDVGRETMMQDMANTGTLYSGKRMEGMRDLGQNAFSQYMSTLQGLAGMGQQTAQNLANIRMGTTQGLVNMGNQFASDTANVRMAQQANQAGLMTAGLEAGAGAAAGIAAAFSDRRLKKDITKVSEVSGLPVYRWKWNDEALSSGLPLGDEVGFMADEVADKYPQFVTEIDGYLAVNYGGLLEHLEAA